MKRHTITRDELMDLFRGRSIETPIGELLLADIGFDVIIQDLRVVAGMTALQAHELNHGTLFTHVTSRAEGLCGCWSCSPPSRRMTMIVCPKCGNKRCPHATHHDNECTNSNASGQRGSRFQ